jgi:hypothetical protein
VRWWHRLQSVILIGLEHRLKEQVSRSGNVGLKVATASRYKTSASPRSRLSLNHILLNSRFFSSVQHYHRLKSVPLRLAAELLQLFEGTFVIIEFSAGLAQLTLSS